MNDAGALVIRPDLGNVRRWMRITGAAVLAPSILGVVAVFLSGDVPGGVFVAGLVGAVAALWIAMDRGVPRMAIRVTARALEMQPALGRTKKVDRAAISRIVLVDRAPRPRAAPTAAIVAVGADGRTLWHCYAVGYSVDDFRTVASATGAPVQHVPTATRREILKRMP